MRRSVFWTLPLVATIATGCGPFAYVSNVGGGTVSILNTSLNLEVGTVSSGVSYPLAVAVTPDGSKAYVGGKCVAVFDTATSTVSEELCLDEPMSFVTASWGIAVHPNGTRAYVTNTSLLNDLTAWVSTLSVLDVTTDSEIARVPLASLPITIDVEPYGLDVMPDGSFVYVAIGDENKVGILDTVSNVLKDEFVAVGSHPVGVAITPDGSHVYVTNLYDHTVSVIATATNAVIATIPVGTLPRGVAIHPNGETAYVASEIEGSVSVIEIDTHTVVDTVLVGAGPYGIDVTPTNLFVQPGIFVYVANSGSMDLSVIDTATNTVVDTVPVGPGTGPTPGPVAFGKFIGPPIIPALENATLRHLAMDFARRLEAVEGDRSAAKRFVRRTVLRHGRELHGILSRDPELARAGFRLLGRFRHVLGRLLEGRPVRVSVTARRELGAWLTAVGGRGSAELRDDLAAFETALAEGFPNEGPRPGALDPSPRGPAR